MPVKLNDKHLLNIAKSTIDAIDRMGYGMHLSSQSGLTLEQLIENACRDRFHLAQGFLISSRRALAQPNPSCRIGLARAYYAMYHAARSVVFYVHRGDDHESHQDVPKNLPKDFVDRARWENELKTAR